MKNKKFWVSLMAGLLAALMIFGIIAGALPAYVSAEKSSAQIQQEISVPILGKKPFRMGLCPFRTCSDPFRLKPDHKLGA